MEKQVASYGARLSVENKQILGKAAEFYRLSSIRCNNTGSKLLPVTSSSKIVVCIDLAATLFEESVDKTLAAKLAGVSRKSYNTIYKTYEVLLNASRPSSIQELAVFANCIGKAENLAQKLLDRFAKDVNSKCNNDKFIDKTKPQFPAAALYVACRHLKVKTSKNKLYDKASISKGMFSKLCGSLEVYLKQIEEDDKEKKSRRGGYSGLDKLMDSLDQNGNRIKHQSDSVSTDDSNDNEISYKLWKEKILSKPD